MHHFSAIAGGMALSLMLIPITARNTEQFLLEVPRTMREGALALGASKWRSIATVIVPAARKGIMTGMILGIARISGETAPLLFTSLNNQFWSTGLSEPTASLPVMIFNYAIAPYEDWHRQAWAAGLVLLALVLLANIAARMVISRGKSPQRMSPMSSSSRMAVSQPTNPNDSDHYRSRQHSAQPSCPRCAP